MAAAALIDLSGGPGAREAKARRAATWQQDAWHYFDEIPEVKQPVLYLGRQLGKLTLYPAVRNAEGHAVRVSDETSGIEAGVAAAIEAHAAKLADAGAEFMSRLEMNLEIVGEAYVVGFAARKVPVQRTDGSTVNVDVPERWQVFAVKEVKEQDGSYTVTTVPNPASLTGALGRTLTPQDSLMRVWIPHPGNYDEADSQMRALRADCEALLAFTHQAIAESRSRRSAGLLLVPSEIEFTQADLPAEGQVADAKDLAADTAEFMKILTAAIASPIEDLTASASVVPTVVRVPAEHIEKLRKLDLARTVEATLAEQIEKKAQRVARGMNLPVEKVMGHQSTTFANADQIDQDEWEDYHQPRAEMIAQALSHGFLQPLCLADKAVPPEVATQVFLWFDATDLVGEPDPLPHLAEAWDRGLVSDAYYRSRRNIPEDAAPTPLELLLRAGLRRGIFDATLTAGVLRLLNVSEWEPEALPAKVDENGQAVQGQAATLMQYLMDAGLAEALSVPRPKALGR